MSGVRKIGAGFTPIYWRKEIRYVNGCGRFTEALWSNTLRYI